MVPVNNHKIKILESFVLRQLTGMFTINTKPNSCSQQLYGLKCQLAWKLDGTNFAVDH